MTVEIRSARPTAEDGVAFAELGNMASHDIIAELVGTKYRQVLAKMYMRRDNLYSHEFAYFATTHGKIAGLTFAFHHRQKVALGKKADQLMMRYVGLGLPRTLFIGFALQPLFNFMDSIPPDAYYLQAIAVYPQFRGQGIGKMLLAKSEEVAHAEGARTLELDVETDNTVAINAYQSQGMTIANSSAEFFFRNQKRHITLHRMVKRLN